MAQKTVTFLASLGNDQDTILDRVDIFDLPYDKMSADNRLMIMQDVSLGNSKKPVWPDMTFVDIFGKLDCGKYSITPDTILPGAFTSLDCSYAIQDLGVLIGKLPPECGVVTIRHALFNNIKSNKDGALDIARRFMAMYPNVTVTDGKITLRDLVTEIDSASHTTQPVTPISVRPVQSPELKTDQWCSTEEVADYCRDVSPLIAQLVDKDLNRLIQQARSSRSNLKLNIAEKLRQTDGAKIMCVHRDDVPRVADYVLRSMSATQERAQHKAASKTKKSSVTTTESAPAKPVKPTNVYYIGDRAVKITKIKKYISKSAWGQVRAKCGTNTADLLRILNDVNDININPTDTRGDQVVYVKDGQVRVSPTIQFKNANCLTQGFGTLDDRPRLVWGISGNVLVCQDFFPAHERVPKYKDCLRNINIDASKLNLDEFLSVPDLIKELSGPRDGDGMALDCVDPVEVKKDEVSTPVDSDSKTVTPLAESVEMASPTPVDVDVVADTVPAPTVRIRRPRIIRSVVDYIAPAKKGMLRYNTKGVNAKDHASATPQVQNNVSIPTKQQWGDVYALAHKYEQQYKELAEQRALVIAHLSQETNIEKMLDLTDRLRVILYKMQERENAIEQLQNINQTLHRLRRDLGNSGH